MAESLCCLDLASVQYAKKQFVKPEFEVAKRMVGLLYFQVRRARVRHQKN